MAHYLPFATRRRTLQALGLVSAFVLGGAFACSAEDTPPSEIMLALQTDMSLPKDVSRVRIQILENGSLKFDKTYNVGGATDEKMPATLAVAGDAGTSVEVRVIGFRGTEARTLNKVISTIPDQRVALLRMPIQWLCEGEVIAVDDDTFESKCSPSGEETSCLGGECLPVHLRSQDMPDYAPSAVFGGAPERGAPGRCFQTEDCMDSGFDVQPNMTDCTVDVMVNGAEQLNFAVRTPMGGDGICRGSNCYVPLDKAEQFGWRDESSTSTGTDGSDAGAKEDAAGEIVPDASVVDAGSPDSGSNTGFGGTAGYTGTAGSYTGAGGLATAGTGGIGGGYSQGGTGTGGTSGAFDSPYLRPQQTSQQQAVHHVKLPKGVCERIGDGRALALRASKTCETKTADIPTCGPWSSVNGSSGGTSDVDGGIAAGDCSEFSPSAGAVVSTGDTLVDQYMQTAASLSGSAATLSTSAGVACQNIISSFGQNFLIDDPPTDDQVMKACDQAATLLRDASITYAITVWPGWCTSNIDLQQSCEAMCAGSVCGEMADTRCDAQSGQCQGSCYGTCYSDGVPVTCSSSCSGTCSGTCTGTCSTMDQYGNCNGVCSGGCIGTCDGACDATGTTCEGICQGDRMLAATACEGSFVGTIECSMPLAPDLCVEQACALDCAAQAGIQQSCQPTSATIADASAPLQLKEAVTMNYGQLSDVVIQSTALTQAAQYAQLAGDGLVNGGLTGKPAACATTAGAAVAQASASISNTTFSVQNLLMLGAGGASGGSTGAGGAVTGGTGGGPPADCMGPGPMALIDDFEDTDLDLSPNDGRGGVWKAMADPFGTLGTWGVEYNATYGWGFHVTSTNTTSWGAVAQVDLNNGGCFDASNWGGINLWAASTATYSKVYVRVITTETMASAAGCVATSGPSCAFMAMMADITSTGSVWSFPWPSFTWDGSVAGPVFDPAHLVRIEIGEPSASAGLWFDNVNFYLP